MSNRINEYREAKDTYFRLRNQAKKELIARFNEVAQELFQLQRELLEDFGEKIAIPSKPKKKRPSKPAKSTGTKQSPPQAGASQKVTAAQKRLQQQKKKLADLQAAGKPTKTVEDRIYELEDELRLAQAK
jgi:hypothetical protein